MGRIALPNISEKGERGLKLRYFHESQKKSSFFCNIKSMFKDLLIAILKQIFLSFDTCDLNFLPCSVSVTTEILVFRKSGRSFFDCRNYLLDRRSRSRIVPVLLRGNDLAERYRWAGRVLMEKVGEWKEVSHVSLLQAISSGVLFS